MPRLAIAAVGVLVVGAVISISVGKGGPGASSIGGTGEVQRIYGGIEQEGAFLGPDDAEVTVTVFTDLRCSGCAEHLVDEVEPVVESFARTGEGRLELRHFSVGSTQTTLPAFAAVAAGEQGRQWQYAALLARNLEASGGEVDDEFLAEIADALPELDVERWQDDRASDEVEAVVSDDAAGADALDFAEPAAVVTGPGGTEELTGSPSSDEIEEALESVG